MGLAASQGRYLSLTARNSDLVYEGQQISQQRLALASESEEISEAYNKAMSNTLLQARTADGQTQDLSYDVLTSTDPFTGLGMRIVDENGYIVVPEAQKNDEYEENNSDHYLVDKNCTKNEYLHKMLETGQWFLQKPNEDSKWEDYDWQGSNQITQIYDTSDDSKAKSEYESKMKTIEKQDKLLEMRLEQVQTQQEAVSKELDSVQQIIEKNIEGSFSTFT